MLDVLLLGESFPIRVVHRMVAEALIVAKEANPKCLWERTDYVENCQK